MTPDVIETIQDEFLLEESLLLGLNAYLHIKWSAAQPKWDSDLKDTPDAWIGICTNNEATAPTKYTAYTWYLWKEKNVDKSFVFDQATPSDNIVVEHGLGKYPSVTVVDSAGTVLVVEVQHLSINQVRIKMDNATPCKVYLN